MAYEPVRTGVIGCGAISGAYLSANGIFDILNIVACADLDSERARTRAAEYGIPRVCSVDELLADPEIELVLNLTVPKAHAELNLAAIRAGKCAYTEKPFAVVGDDGRRVLAVAAEAGVLVGGAPDTFFGDGGQTSRRLLDQGAIGAPVAATAFMMGHGHESWHPSPEFFYEKGGGPMFDMGPYYITALVHLLGPVTRVTGFAGTSFPTRTIASEPQKGKVIPVETPTHVTGAMLFASGVIATTVMSFDVWAHRHPCIEVHGTEGSMLVPNPNGFAGPVLVAKPGEDFVETPLLGEHPEYQRGVGAADLAQALRSGRSPRAGGELAQHVLEIMEAFVGLGTTGGVMEIRSTCQRPAAVPSGLPAGGIDA